MSLRQGLWPCTGWVADIPGMHRIVLGDLSPTRRMALIAKNA